MKVYVFCVDGEPIHSFVAADDHIAAAVARGMINKTAYAYKGDTEIIVASGLKPNDPPKIFDALIELYCVDIDGVGLSAVAPVRLIKDPLIDRNVLQALFDACLPRKEEE